MSKYIINTCHDLLIKKPNVLTVDDIVLNHQLDKMNSGDILLFSGQHSFISSIIKWWTNSYYSHVGIVLKNPYIYHNDMYSELKGYYLLESGEEDIVDVEDHVKKYGVQIVPLREVIENYDGEIFWRKLNIDSTTYNYETLNFMISKIYRYVKNKPYDLNIFDLLCSNINLYRPPKLYNYAILNWLSHDEQKQDKFVCSALVAYMYTKLNFLPQLTHWTECIPKFFSDENSKLELLAGAYLEEQKKIK